MASITADLPHDRLPIGTRVLYGTGSMVGAANGALMGFLLFYYNQIVGVPAHLISIVLGITVFIDAFWDPLIGLFSDNLRTKWGRRHPLMYASIIPMVVTVVMVWNPPDGLTDLQTVTYLLGMVLIMRLSTSFFDVPNGALVPELAPDYDDRTSIMSYRFFFGTLGRVIATFIILGIFLKDTPEYPHGQLNPAGYGPMAIAIASFMAVMAIICALGTHSRIPRLHVPPVRKVDLKETTREVFSTLKNWNFGVAVTASLIFGISTGLTGGLGLYFNTFLWGLNAQELLFLTYSAIISAPIGAVLAPILSRKWGKRRTCMTLFFISVATNNAPIFLRLIGFFPDNDSPWLLPILIGDSIITGILGIAGFIIVTSMIADIVEDSQMKTGRRSEGLLFSADSLLQKVVSAVAGIVPGILITWVGLPRGARPDTVDPTIMHTLGWIYLPISVFLSLASISCWWLYRIDKATHERNLASIREAAASADELIERGVEPPAVRP